LKIGQHLPKLWTIKYRVVFYETRCRIALSRAHTSTKAVDVAKLLLLNAQSLTWTLCPHNTLNVHNRNPN